MPAAPPEPTSPAAGRLPPAWIAVLVAAWVAHLAALAAPHVSGEGYVHSGLMMWMQAMKAPLTVPLALASGAFGEALAGLAVLVSVLPINLLMLASPMLLWQPERWALSRFFVTAAATAVAVLFVGGGWIGLVLSGPDGQHAGPAAPLWLVSAVLFCLVSWRAARRPAAG